MYLLNEWRFLVDIWCEDVLGDKGVSRKICADATFDLDPVTLMQNCMIIPFHYGILERMTIFGWYLVGGVSLKTFLSMWPLTFKPKFHSTLYLLSDVSGDKGV
jgi:hypothetical protein